MCEDNWTEQETDRQDRVDNAIFNAIEEITPIGYLQWDMELIAEVREVIMDYVVNKKKWMTEQQFYPYRETDKDGNIILEPSKEPEPERLVVTVEQLDKAIKQVLLDLDFDDLAKVAGDFLGGLCVWDEGNNFIFVTDQNYNGALDFTKGKRNE